MSTTILPKQKFGSHSTIRKLAVPPPHELQSAVRKGEAHLGASSPNCQRIGILKNRPTGWCLRPRERPLAWRGGARVTEGGASEGANNHRSPVVEGGMPTRAQVRLGHLKMSADPCGSWMDTCRGFQGSKLVLKKQC